MTIPVPVFLRALCTELAADCALIQLQLNVNTLTGKRNNRNYLSVCVWGFFVFPSSDQTKRFVEKLSRETTPRR